jgi:TetR/AcrR family transcriptional regulator
MVKADQYPEQSEAAEERILKAATKIFREKGREGARMQEIADAAGINKALLHYYFRSKDQLFERVFQESARLFFFRLNEILQSERDIFQKITQLCDAYISLSVENPFIPVFIIGEMNRTQDIFISNMFTATQSRPDFSFFRQQLHEAASSGLLTPLAPHQLIMNILGLCVFPVISKPMMQFNMGIGEKEFMALMEERKQLIPALIISSLKIEKSE